MHSTCQTDSGAPTNGVVGGGGPSLSRLSPFKSMVILTSLDEKENALWRRCSKSRSSVDEERAADGGGRQGLPPSFTVFFGAEPDKRPSTHDVCKNFVFFEPPPLPAI